MSDRDLRDHLAPAYDETEVADAWRAISSARHRPTRPKRGWLVLVPGFALAAAAVIAIVVVTRAPRPAPTTTHAALRSIDPVSHAPSAISVEAGTKWEPVAGPTQVALDDGSRVRVAPRSQLQVLANDGARFSMLLERGEIDVTVEPGGPRRWEIETPLATVEAIGSAFRVAQYEHRVVIAVERGTLMVRGERVKGRVQRLVEGQELVVEDTITAVVEPPSPPTTPPATPPVAPSTSDTPPAVVAVEPKREPTPAPSTLPAPPSPATISNAIFEADRLASSEPAKAAQTLETALAAAPNDPSAGLARFALGRLYLESLGQPAKAVPLFRTIIARGSPHSLLEDAHARLVEALLKAGDAGAARAAFGEYERLYPQGRRLAALRAML